jgi:hypothetical protein
VLLIDFLIDLIPTIEDLAEVAAANLAMKKALMQQVEEAREEAKAKVAEVQSAEQLLGVLTRQKHGFTTQVWLTLI